jgi:hypothetical protein
VKLALVAFTAVASLLLDPGAHAAPGGVVRVEHRDPGTAPSRGPKHAHVTIDFFLQPNASLGSRVPAIRALERLQANHPTRIRLVYRIVKRTGTVLVAIALLEAHAQGKFDELITELHLDRTTQQLQIDKVLEIAKRAGMDTARLSAAMTDGRYNDALAQNEQRLGRFTHTENASVPNVLFNSKTIRAAISAPSDADLEREYVTAYERALDMLDRGVPQERLGEAFDEHALRRDQPFVMSHGDDEDEEFGSNDHKLAKPPLDLRGMPSFGKVGAAGAMSVVILCHPRDHSCFATLGVGKKLQQIYANDIRIVYAPWFDVARDDATELAILGDTILCAEQVGSIPDDLDESPGWAWISRQLEVVGRGARRTTVEKLIDTVTQDLKFSSGSLSACRARMANTTLEWITKARKSGVTRSPAVVIGGRIYEGLTDSGTIQQLIDSELAPGVLARCSTIGCSSE